MGVTLLDSGVIAGFLQRDDALHRPAARAVRDAAAGGRLVASVVTFAEVLTGARLGHHDEAIVRGFFRDVLATVVTCTPDLAERAAAIRSDNRGLRLPDAVILATGELHADRIVTGDRRWTGVAGLGVSIQLVGGPASAQ